MPVHTDMRAFALDAFGEPGSIHEVPVPEPGEGQVRVRIAAASINPFDLFVLKGALKDRMEHRFPLIPCGDLSGTVDAVGPGVTEFKPGDAVFGTQGKPWIGGGTLAEETLASTATIAHRPRSLDAVAAAALPLAGVSALMCLDAVDPRPGDAVVIIGASGGIGGYAVQIAAARGAHVIGVTSAAHLDYVKSLGASEVLDRNEGDVRARIRSLHPGGVAALIDTISDQAALPAWAELVRDGGAVASMRGAVPVDELARRGVRGTNIGTQSTTARLAELGRLADEGRLKPGLVHRFPLERAAEALESAGRGAGGKVVVTT